MKEQQVTQDDYDRLWIDNARRLALDVLAGKRPNLKLYIEPSDLDDDQLQANLPTKKSQREGVTSAPTASHCRFDSM